MNQVSANGIKADACVGCLAGTYLPAIYGTDVVANLEAAMNAEFKNSTNVQEFVTNVKAAGLSLTMAINE